MAPSKISPRRAVHNNNNKLIAALLPSVPRIIHMIITQTHCCATVQASPELCLNPPHFSLFKYYQTQTVRDKTFHPSARNEKSQSYRNNKFANKPGNFTSLFFFCCCGSSTFFRRRAFLLEGVISRQTGSNGQRKQSLFGRLDDNNSNNIFYICTDTFFGVGDEGKI